MKKLLLIFLLINLKIYPDSQTGHYEEACRVVNSFIDKAIEKHDLIFLGWSGAMFSNVKELDVRFESTSINDISKARNEVVNLTEMFLSIINNDEKIKKHLNEYPFSSKNIKISIQYVHNANLDDSIAFGKVVMLYGIILYSPHRGMKYLKKETYEEAKEIVNLNTNKDLMLLH